MARREPISKYMHPTPYCVGQAEPLNTAHALMREHGIRHLPVLDAARLVGVVSERDLALLERFAGVDPATFRIAKAMRTDPLTVPPDAPIDDVARQMAERKSGSAIVVDGDRVVGVFTTTDALRALSHVLAGASRRRREAG